MFVGAVKTEESEAVENGSTESVGAVGAGMLRSLGILEESRAVWAMLDAVMGKGP